MGCGPSRCHSSRNTTRIAPNAFPINRSEAKTGDVTLQLNHIYHPISLGWPKYGTTQHATLTLSFTVVLINSNGADRALQVDFQNARRR
ncbi:hypothetical protein BN2476_300154 [Paraburkholderia piptadeniae]|uniref:Uncharacterized protein n=1 Tax=Paraburkholderia piptadeniae TaxID=1701573 RepID=A0A1N7S411_9BURK|nr:hypothetical protein BN2476_300154 [Paraburkholderia piptadeniae]